MIELAHRELRAALVDARFDEPLSPALDKAVGLVGGFEPRPGSLIVIKPNLTTDKYPARSGVTTDVALTTAVVDGIVQVSPGCQFKIVESQSDGTVQGAFDRLEYSAWADTRSDVDLVNLDECDFVKIVLPDGMVRSIEVPDILLDMDYFISIAVLKRHMQERLSCVWKNAYGLPSNHIQRMRRHPFLKEILLALNTIFWPDLSIIDARVGLRGPGPFVGEPQPYGKLIVSKNPLATDITAVRLIDERVKNVPALRYAVKKLKVVPEEVEIWGDPWQPKPLPFVDNELGFKLYRWGLWLRRFGALFERAGLLSMLTGAAVREGAATQYMGGGTQSLGTSWRVVWEMLTKVELGEVPYE